MKLLFDQNLSFKLCVLLADLFPDSKLVGWALTGLTIASFGSMLKTTVSCSSHKIPILRTWLLITVPLPK